MPLSQPRADAAGKEGGAGWTSTTWAGQVAAGDTVASALGWLRGMWAVASMETAKFTSPPIPQVPAEMTNLD